jgi:hypothetical protein
MKFRIEIAFHQFCSLFWFGSAEGAFAVRRTLRPRVSASQGHFPLSSARWRAGDFLEEASIRLAEKGL